MRPSRPAVPNCPYRRTDTSVSSFRFDGVDEVRLDGLNNQNVLWDLVITDIRDRQLDELKYEVTFSSSFGMGASFLGRSVAVQQVEPWRVRRESDG